MPFSCNALTVSAKPRVLTPKLDTYPPNCVTNAGVPAGVTLGSWNVLTLDAGGVALPPVLAGGARNPAGMLATNPSAAVTARSNAGPKFVRKYAVA